MQISQRDLVICCRYFKEIGKCNADKSKTLGTLLFVCLILFFTSHLGYFNADISMRLGNLMQIFQRDGVL